MVFAISILGFSYCYSKCKALERKISLRLEINSFRATWQNNIYFVHNPIQIGLSALQLLFLFLQHITIRTIPIGKLKEYSNEIHTRNFQIKLSTSLDPPKKQAILEVIKPKTG